jgi:hypothetical protein
MWAVVEFAKDKSIAAVPYSWININDCFWPKWTGDKLRRAIRNKVEPDRSWELLGPVRILYSKCGMMLVINFVLPCIDQNNCTIMKSLKGLCLSLNEFLLNYLFEISFQNI